MIGKWLQSLIESSIALELPPADDDHDSTFSLSDGVLCFDIDRTLLTPGKSLADDEFRTLRNLLAGLLVKGVRVSVQVKDEDGVTFGDYDPPTRPALTSLSPGMGETERGRTATRDQVVRRRPELNTPNPASQPSPTPNKMHP